MAICPNCSTNNAPGATHCASCGTPLSSAIYGVAPAVPGKGLGIASMVLGIISLVLFCIWYISIPCAIIGAALGGVALNKAKAVGMKNGLGTAGLVCSVIAIGLAILFIILVAIGLAEMGLF